MAKMSNTKGFKSKPGFPAKGGSGKMHGMTPVGQQASGVSGVKGSGNTGMFMKGGGSARMAKMTGTKPAKAC